MIPTVWDIRHTSDNILTDSLTKRINTLRLVIFWYYCGIKATIPTKPLEFTKFKFMI